MDIENDIRFLLPNESYVSNDDICDDIEDKKLSDCFHKFCEKRNKKLITLRLDEDIVDWFQSKGRGYQTRMNAALRAVMQVEKDKENELF